MAATNRERIGTGMDLLQAGLRPFVEREMRAVYRAAWLDEIAIVTGQIKASEADLRLDTQALLKLIDFRWNEVFKRKLSRNDRSYAILLRDARNEWAHQGTFSGDETYRTLDAIEVLLTSAGAPQAAEVQRMKLELQRLRDDERARQVLRRTTSAPLEGQPASGLKPWRALITPHRDVAAGRFQQAEFAADLAQVHRGEGVDEYRDPVEFFRRTFLTEGLRHMLVNGLRRLASGDGGDPVVKLQTNFGGGKTHSMLGLYHLFSGVDVQTLPGIETVLQEAGVDTVPDTRRAVLVGTQLGIADARRKSDGTMVNTIWGEMAWQLLGSDGYQFVAAHDIAGTNPGSDILRDLFIAAQPALVLIDEWVAYIRNTWNVERIPAGTFDNNLSFAQSLTEAARAVPGILVVASLPASDIEVGGDAGLEALTRLENTFSRVETVWKPASAQEGFEIVRRRLFEDMPVAQLRERDAVIRAFIEFYRQHANEFPQGVSEKEYERQMQAAYPIHPELFDRLYEDWSQLEKFQRTRGVLRLMAAVIHTLWEREDHSLLIMPASIPIDDPAVQFELTRYLEDRWQPIIEKDVDGTHALPREIDAANAGTLGRYSATRRVARTVYMGSAPRRQAANVGIDDRHIRLGCVQPGEAVATFGDALRRLANDATYLYTDGGRYWYSTTPTVNNMARDRAAQQRQDDVLEEIRERLRADGRERGQFARVHITPRSSSDVADDDQARLVILDPEHTHQRATDSPARRAAQEMLDNRGQSPRLNRNMLLFLAADSRGMAALEQSVRDYLAWQSINKDAENLNLDAFQRNQARTKLEQAQATLKSRVPEAYVWLLTPTQAAGTGAVEWTDTRLQGDGAPAERASRKAINDGTLIAEIYGHSLLRMELDQVPLWRGEDVLLRQLWEDFSRYLYLPRLRDRSILLRAAQTGIGQMLWVDETWAYAQRKDANGRYHGLTTALGSSVTLDEQSMLVHPSAATRQLDADQRLAAERETRTREALAAAAGADTAPLRSVTADSASAYAPERAASPQGAAAAAPPRVLRRYYGSVDVDPIKTSSAVGTIVQEIVQHLTAQYGASVRLTLEIEADLPNGAPEHVVRTVVENARALNFVQSAFEE